MTKYETLLVLAEVVSEISDAERNRILNIVDFSDEAFNEAKVRIYEILEEESKRKIV